MVRARGRVKVRVRVRGNVLSGDLGIELALSALCMVSVRVRCEFVSRVSVRGGVR